jgi:hypothetical protein
MAFLVDAALQAFREERNRIRLQQKEVLSLNLMIIQFSFKNHNFILKVNVLFVHSTFDFKFAL